MSSCWCSYYWRLIFYICCWKTTPTLNLFFKRPSKKCRRMFSWLETGIYQVISCLSRIISMYLLLPKIDNIFLNEVSTSLKSEISSKAVCFVLQRIWTKIVEVLSHYKFESIHIIWVFSQLINEPSDRNCVFQPSWCKLLLNAGSHDLSLSVGTSGEKA